MDSSYFFSRIIIIIIGFLVSPNLKSEALLSGKKDIVTLAIHGAGFGSPP
jgi:hypothetical protein